MFLKINDCRSQCSTKVIWDACKRSGIDCLCARDILCYMKLSFCHNRNCQGPVFISGASLLVKDFRITLPQDGMSLLTAEVPRNRIQGQWLDGAFLGEWQSCSQVSFCIFKDSFWPLDCFQSQIMCLLLFLGDLESFRRKFFHTGNIYKCHISITMPVW